LIVPVISTTPMTPTTTRPTHSAGRRKRAALPLPVDETAVPLLVTVSEMRPAPVGASSRFFCRRGAPVSAPGRRL